MIARNATAIVAAAVLAVSAQNATLNVAGDDSATVYLNGAAIGNAGNGAFPVTIVQGSNVLAVSVKDAGWAAGLAVSIDLNSCGTADTVITDGTWKVSDESPAGWETAAFDASSWRTAGAYGGLADDTANARYNLDSLPWANTLYQHKAQWLWTPPKVYFRKTFDRTTADSGFVGLLGGGFAYKLWLNDTLVGGIDTARDASAPINSYQNKHVWVGANVIAIEATCLDSLNMAYVKAGMWKSAQNRFVVSDSTWKYSFDTAAGWTTRAYSDASWKLTQTKTGSGAAGPLGSAAAFMWPSRMYFRTTFTAPVAGVRNPGVTASKVSSKVTARGYYTLQGQRLSARAANSAANSIVIERATLSNGTAATQAIQSK